MEEKAGISLAYHLGRALQLTNILRDIDEDAGIGRLYLPREALQQAGIIDAQIRLRSSRTRASAKVCEQVVARARVAFRRGRPHHGEGDAQDRARRRASCRWPIRRSSRR